MRSDEDSLGAVSQDYVEQLITFIDIDRDDAVRSNILKIIERSLLDDPFTSHHYDVPPTRKLSHWNHSGQFAI